LEEKGKHLQAFERYYALGIKRTIPQLAKDLGISEPTLKRWAKAFNWNKRVDQKDRLVFEKMQKENAEEFEKAIIFYQKSIRELIKRDFIEPLKRGGELPFEIKSAKDLEVLMKLDVLLGGGVTSRSETINKEQKKENEVRVVELIQNDEDVWEALNQQYLEEGEGE
jgi:tetratricopeptide (TPR) repeat protein